MGKYWMVHRDSGGGRGPTFRHATFKSAAKEAERLARKDLTRFVVLEAVMSFEPSREPIELTIERIDPDCDCAGGDKRAEEPDYHTASGSGGPGCSCYWCDPENHDPEICEFPSCGCKALAHIRSLEFLTDLFEEANRRWPSDTLDALPPEIMERYYGLIPRADCPCGCTDDKGSPELEVPRFVRCAEGARAKHPSPLGEGEAELRREWMPDPRVDLSSCYAGWTIEDFEHALARNLQGRSNLCAGLKAVRVEILTLSDDMDVSNAPTHECGGQPEGAHWCPHCGDDLVVLSRGEEN